tara:strand:+ start:50290 stop:54438 length:4149 start_codon:yes stop_codon:yes gene_type:complete
VSCQIEILEDRTLLTSAFSELANPNPYNYTHFGDAVVTLSTGNIVVTDPTYGGFRGAVYLFNGENGELISTLIGDRYEQIGSGGVTALPNGNFLVSSPRWSNGNLGYEFGAVTFGNGVTGVSGVISADNSLIGASPDDRVGGGSITLLNNGNYLVSSPFWDNDTMDNVGAVTFGDGATGVTGVISQSNSLIGANEGDSIGFNGSNGLGVRALSNDNYIVGSPFWDNGSSEDAGALTWGNGITGTTGVVSLANSLVGSSEDDRVGDFKDGYINITLLSNGNYVLSSPQWDNGAAEDAGAVTFGNGTIGVTGEISSANSLVGTTAGDKVGYFHPTVASVTELTNGNYVVTSPFWDNDTILDAGAVAFGSGTNGVTGEISATNSLVGVTKNDRLGYINPTTKGITALTNGNYVVSSPGWNNGSVSDAGAATFGNGTTGVSGVIDGSNSLVGLTKNDLVGIAGVTALTNGNYVVSSPAWSDSSELGVGAVTFGNGITGVIGAISSDNSLVGSDNADNVGMGGVTALPNGNYVAISYNWSFRKGAVTFGNGTTGIAGVLAVDNSLVGTEDLSYVGLDGVTVLANGNYVVISSSWGNESFYDVGAVTWGSGTAGISGAVSAANSLVGAKRDDKVGSNGVTALTNGNYVVSSSRWDNDTVSNAGAVTFGNGTTGISGLVSMANSLVGSTINDGVGFNFSDESVVTTLSNGNYVVNSPHWDNGSAADAGAVTFGNGTSGVSGVISETNSLVGTTSGDRVGYYRNDIVGVTALQNGNYLVRSPDWKNGTNNDGAGVTFGNGTSGVSGYLNSNNSVASTLNDPYNINLYLDDVNHTFFVVYDEGNSILVGSQVDGFMGTTFDLIQDVVISENAAEQSIDLTGLERAGAAEGAVVWSSWSDNPEVIPPSGLVITEEGGAPTLRINPPAGRTGTARIRVQVEDGGLDSDLETTQDNGIFQRSFDLTINPIEESLEEHIALRVVSSPTTVDSSGEVVALPENQSWISEWATYWVEIWVSTENLSNQGITQVAVDLSYQTNYTSATEIKFGNAFTQNQAGTINDGTGLIAGLSAEASMTDLGINTQLLFARIKYESLVADGVFLDLDGQSIGPYDLEFQLIAPQIGLGNERTAVTPLINTIGSKIWANPFDLNDNDAVDFRDLSLFAAVYGKKPSESSNDYAWFSDYNQNDRVDFRDLSLFVSNYRSSKTGNADIHYPANFPDAWDNPLLVSIEPQTKTKTASLTQAEAEQVVEKAIAQASKQFTSEMNELLSGVEVKVVDLPGRTLGRAVPGTIYLDVNAAGHGWFIDDTPLDHSEFAFNSQLSLIALPENAAAGRVDLWTVILHELGHLVGYEHETEGVMAETLSPGVRKLAEWEENSDLFFASVQEEAELLPF